MKNRLVMFAAVLLLVLGSAAVSAAETGKEKKTQEDTWFTMLADGTRKSLPAGARMVTDDKLRFIIISLKLPVKSDKVTQEAFQQQKPHFIKLLQQTADADFMRKTGTTLIYNYVTEDYVVFSVVISHKDL